MAVVVITGASRGIGLELTAQLLRRGDSVVATYRDEPGKQRLVALGFVSTLTLRQLDVRDEASVAAFAASLAGPIDVLVNSAGVMGPEHQRIESTDYAGWLDTLLVNVHGPFRVTTALLPRLRQSSNARVITLSSIMGCLSRKSAGYYAYRSSKAAVNKVMQLLANELRGEGIVACPVHPGWVRTEMGGYDAELSVEESARGLIALLDGLTLERSGRFWQWNGTELPW